MMEFNQGESHSKRVMRVVEAVKSRPTGKKLSIRKATPSHQLHNLSWKEQCHRVDVSDFTNVLGFERGCDRSGAETLIAHCEGMVTMVQLVRASMALGYIPQVVPEHSDFTVAGLINGEGIQSSCFRYGIFTHTVTEMTVVLGNGDVVTCSPTNEFRELFTFMVESYGTIGIVVAAKVALRPALPFVRTKYILHRTLSDFVRDFEPMVRSRRGDFLEGIVFSKDCFVIIHSTFCSSRDDQPFYDPFPFDCDQGERYYYQYIKQIVLKNGVLSRGVDVIPTESFVFRSERGLYWMLESYIDLPLLTNQKWFRRHADKKVIETRQKKGFEASGHLSPEEQQRCLVQQDMGIMLKRLEEGISWVQKNLGVYPLWICPVWGKLTLKNNPEFLKLQPEAAKCLDDEFLCDIGIYGEPTVRPFFHRKVVKALQEFVDAPSMWGVCYKSKDEIKAAWNPIRTKYHAIDAFPGVEEKTTFRGVDDNDEEREIPYWRLVNEYGWYWWIKLPAIASLALGSLCWLLWSTVSFVGQKLV